MTSAPAPPDELITALVAFRAASTQDRRAFLDGVVECCDFGDVFHLRKRLRPRTDDVLTCLPVEIANKVLECLDGKQLMTVRKVCRHWRRLTMSNVLWKQKVLEICPWIRNISNKGPRPSISTWDNTDAFHTYLRLTRRDRRWERGTPRKTHLLSAGSDKLLALKLTPPLDPTRNGGTLISAGYDRHVRFFHFLGGKWQTWLESIDTEMTINCLDMDMSNMTVACGGFNGVCKVYRERQLMWNLQSHAGPVTSLAMNEKVVVTGGTDHCVCVWDVESGMRMNVFVMHQERVSGVCIVGDLVLSSSYDGTIFCWDIQRGRFTRNIGPSQPVLGLTATLLPCSQSSRGGLEEKRAIVTYSTWQGLWRRVIDQADDVPRPESGPARRRVSTRLGAEESTGAWPTTYSPTTASIPSSRETSQSTSARDLSQPLARPPASSTYQPIVFPWPKSACAYLSFSTQSRIISATSTQLMVWQHDDTSTSHAHDPRLVQPTMLLPPVLEEPHGTWANNPGTASASGSGSFAPSSKRDICALDSNAGFVAVGCIDGTIKVMEF